ncbi:MAG TPA: hypothetical protein VHB25_04530 [Gemmatimonadaceae bacterium]|nr:hypothetical protein [Gemmatimonadaceae bacterium]
MRHFVALVLAAMVVSVAASGAGAQVGYPPASSPYVDLEHTQELTLLLGEFHAHRDPVNAAPQSGPLVGLHYEWRAGGPAHLIAEVDRISSQREVINPFKVGAAQRVGTVNRPLYAGNVGLGLSLTGGKSWHHIVPEVAAGVGLISDLRAQPDTGGFRFGTRFALNWGGGIRWVPGGHLQVRGDITNRLYTIGYPEAFYVAPTGGKAVIPQSQSKSFWTNNPAFTLGLSYFF